MEKEKWKKGGREGCDLKLSGSSKVFCAVVLYVCVRVRACVCFWPKKGEKV